MKTTIELSDELANAAKTYAAEHKITLRSLVERGLREVMPWIANGAASSSETQASAGGVCRPNSVSADWSRIRDAVYKGRGS